MPVMPLLVPTIAFYYLSKYNKMPQNKVIKTGLEIMIFVTTLTFAPPMACALFPQYTKTKVKNLEPEFQSLKDSNGSTITHLYYNKGL